MQKLIPIGRFARLTGLTVKALRHYDAVGLLPPTAVDPVTPRRSYQPDQLARARAIRRLRSIDLPLDEVRAVLDAPDGGAARLAAYRRRVEARLARDQRILHQLWHLDKGDDMATLDQRHTSLPPNDQRQLAADLFNLVWEFLEKPDRSAADDDRMLHAAHASRYHWGEVGKPINLARGEWQCSRVYAVLDRAEPAIHHGLRCLQLCTEHDAEAIDLAAAHEALARAYAVAGQWAESGRHRERGLAAADEIVDAEERQMIIADLGTVPLA